MQAHHTRPGGAFLRLVADATPVELTGPELDTIRRAIVDLCAEDLRNAAEKLLLATGMEPWSHVAVADAQVAIGVARDSLTLVDKLGWPKGGDR